MNIKKFSAVLLFMVVTTVVTTAAVSPTFTYLEIEAALALDPAATSMLWSGANHATTGQQRLYYSSTGIMVSDPNDINGGSYLSSGGATRVQASSAGSATVSMHGSFSAQPACSAFDEKATPVLFSAVWLPSTKQMSLSVSGAASGDWIDVQCSRATQ